MLKGLLGGGLIAFEGFEAVSQFIPVPYLQLAVMAASHIIRIARVSARSPGVLFLRAAR